MSLLRNAVEAASDDDGWAPLSSVGNITTNQRPDFDSRSYGYGKLSDLIKATTLFEIERRSPGEGKQALMYARVKPRGTCVPPPSFEVFPAEPGEHAVASAQTAITTTRLNQIRYQAVFRRFRGMTSSSLIDEN